MRLIELNKKVSGNLKNEIGIKALNLMKISVLDFITIPEGFVIPISVLDKVENGTINLENFSNAVFEKCKDVFLDEEPKLFAVRSSSPNEDNNDKSYAGQYLTKLNVKMDSIISVIIQVYKTQSFISGYTTQEKVRVGVIVQKMIIPDFSGVLFTQNPKNATESLIEYDESLLDNYVSGNSSGIGSISVSRDSINSFHEDNIFNKIFKIGLKLEKEFGNFCDIEWAVKNSQVYIMQVRPITTLGEIKLFFGKTNVFDFWTDGNVGEVLPSKMTILSWTIFGKMINDLLRQSFKFLSNEYNIDDVCFIKMENGYLQYNIGAVNYFTHDVLGFPKMDEIIGGNNTDWSQVDYSLNWKKIIKNFRVVFSNSKMFSDLPNKSENAYIRIGDYANELSKIDYSKLSTKELVAQFKEVKNNISKEMFLHTEATSASFSLVALVKYLLQKKQLPNNLLNELLSNIKGVKIVELITQINAMKSKISEENLQIVCDILKKEQWKKLLDENNFLELRKELTKLINKYGHRGSSELELSVPTWGENPSKFLIMISNLWSCSQLEESSIDISHFIKTNNFLKDQSKIYLFILKKIVEEARMYTRYRENNKHYLYLLVYQLRRIISEFKNRISKIYVEDFYNLSEEELINLLSGNFSIDVQLIKNRIDRMSSTLVDYRIDNNSCKIIQGMSASFGMVEGKIKILKSINEISKVNENEIIVLKSIDIGWTPVFPIVKGIITEIGGVLSHASIIARELKVPVIVNVEHATDLFANGEEVVLDANKGIIFKKQ